MKLSQANTASGLSQSDKLLAEVGGSVRSVSVSDYRRSLDASGEQTLRETAWGIPLRQTANTRWGTLGNWSLYRSYASQVGRHLVTPDGRAAKLSARDSSVFADGTPLDETKGNVMVIGPRLYYDVVDDSAVGCPVLWMSESPISDKFLANAGGKYNCYGAYMGSLSGGALVSRSGVAPQTGKSIREFWSAAQQNGLDWGLLDYDGWRWLCMLALCEAGGDANVQSVLGYGVCGSATVSTDPGWLTGATISLGDETSRIPISDNHSRVSILGAEDFYGWYQQFIQGVFKGSSANAWQGRNDVFIYQGNRIPTTSELASRPLSEYRTTTTTTTTYGNTKKMALGKHCDLVATEVGGSSSQYWCDRGFFTSNKQIASIGGHYAQSVESGPFSLYINLSSTETDSKTSARLGYNGNLTLTNGKNII